MLRVSGKEPPPCCIAPSRSCDNQSRARDTQGLCTPPDLCHNPLARTGLASRTSPTPGFHPRCPGGGLPQTGTTQRKGAGSDGESNMPHPKPQKSFGSLLLGPIGLLDPDFDHIYSPPINHGTTHHAIQMGEGAASGPSEGNEGRQVPRGHGHGTGYFAKGAGVAHLKGVR
jgi:hypothetical protein